MKCTGYRIKVWAIEGGREGERRRGEGRRREKETPA